MSVFNFNFTANTWLKTKFEPFSPLLKVSTVFRTMNVHRTLEPSKAGRGHPLIILDCKLMLQAKNVNAIKIHPLLLVLGFSSMVTLSNKW